MQMVKRDVQNVAFLSVMADYPVRVVIVNSEPNQKIGNIEECFMRQKWVLLYEDVLWMPDSSN